jgi:spore coat protein U-like protein
MRSQRLILSGITAVLLGIASAATFADTVNGSFNVKVQVLKACSVTPTNPADIVFDTVSTTSTAAQSKTTSIAVQCSKTTPYEIGLTPSNSNTTGAGVMTKTGATSPTADQKIAYQINSPTNSPWGNQTGAGGNTVTGTGTGAVQTYVATAAVAGTVWNVEPGNYADTVTVTVTY